MPNEMRSLETEVSQQSPAVGGLLGDANGAAGTAAAAMPAAVIENELVPADQARFRKEGLERIGNERAVDEYDGFAPARNPVFQFASPVESHVFHSPT
jgi:hypothetical protein